MYAYRPDFGWKFICGAMGLRTMRLFDIGHCDEVSLQCALNFPTQARSASGDQKSGLPNSV